MQRREFTVALALIGAWGWESAWAAGFTESEAANGIRSALERGAVAAIGSLGRTDGFLGNPRVRIPLPGILSEAANLLRVTGQQKRVDELVTAMNRAAEAALPEARSLLVYTAKSISVQDAIRIVRGGGDSVTKYFAGKTRGPLGERFLPIVTRATERVALADKFNAVAGRAGKLGLLRGDDTNIQRYVTGKALDGLYLMIGEEERKIRSDPVGTGSAILRKVFGA